MRRGLNIYMEATIAQVKSRAFSKGPEIMVITDDRIFFKVFTSSPTAETILLSQVEMALKPDSVEAGEIPRQRSEATYLNQTGGRTSPRNVTITYFEGR